MKKPNQLHSNHRGFALIATILLMVLLAIITVGTLSLSVVTVRSGGHESAQNRARANAKMALMIAIGELQKQAGPDQRITANGGILDNTNTPANEVLHPHWTGVWNSWKAGDGTSFHRSVQGESLMGMSPTYRPGRSDYFRSWLLSLNPSETTDWDAPLKLTLVGEEMPSKNQDTILLVGEGSLGSRAQPVDYVSARLINIYDSNTTNDLTGRYGWWVGDQNQKARVMGDSYEKESTLTLAQKIARGQAPGSTGSKSIRGLEAMNAAQEARLDIIPSLNTLDLVIENNTQRPAQRNFHAITPFSEALLTDVREGGLKRDLSALLERKIDPSEFDNYPNEFSLYRFNTKDAWAAALGASAPQEVVPLQDLATYYQLYDSLSPQAAAQDSLRTSNKRGVRYSPDPSLHSEGNGINGIHMLSMDYGLGTNSPVYQSANSALYRQPRVVKVQFLASLFSNTLDPTPPGDRANPPNTHELLIGLTPSITFWNPTNIPIIFQMNKNPALSAQMMRFYLAALNIQIIKRNHRGEEFTSSNQSIHNLMGFSDGLNLYWAGIHPIRLEPGEVKTLSLPFSGDLTNLKSTHNHQGHWSRWNTSFFMKTDTWYVGHEVQQGWEPESFIHFPNSAGGSVTPNNGSTPSAGAPADTRHVVNSRMRFKRNDRIQIRINSVGTGGFSWMQNQSSYQDFCKSPLTQNMGLTNWDRHNASMALGGTGLFQRGMAGSAATLTTPSRTGSAIIARSTRNAGWPFMHFGVFAGVETRESSNGGFAGGRKFASRPFLHSSPIQSAPTANGITGDSLYNFGWNWSVNLLNDVYEAPVQVTRTGSSYWGGGYTPESGTTHIIQQEIPVIPPISIAALSHAHLGGWSLGDQREMPYGGSPGQMGHISAERMRHLNRAIGFGGLRPFTTQAIGNSYAHPQLRADQTHVTNINRTYRDGTYPESFADHSYLANKALWDEYFFSSITPQRSSITVFESSNREAEDVAREFFFNNMPLPNRRMKPYTSDLDEAKLTSLFARKDDFTNGLADKIAAHLMVDGGFNVNSTSVDAWKVFFSSLKGKPVAYIEKSSSLTGAPPVLATGHTGTPIGQVGLAGGAPFTGSPDDPRDSKQWTNWRELTDKEIDELAIAMVKQVKLRGPFLSLSEFVNRRLDSTNPELSAKGALQAALDDPNVSINEGFRSADRKFTASEVASMGAAFPLAAEGPVAYGSSAYIDQADILRSFAEQLSPRGDTFVIRAYGDHITPDGKVAARAWCEAVVQRLPEYVDGTNNPDILPNNSAFTDANKLFGRKFQIVSFRWLNPSEV